MNIALMEKRWGLGDQEEYTPLFYEGFGVMEAIRGKVKEVKYKAIIEAQPQGEDVFPQELPEQVMAQEDFLKLL